MIEDAGGPRLDRIVGLEQENEVSKCGIVHSSTMNKLKKHCDDPVAKPARQYCTFCGARDDEVQLLVTCYTATICDRCVQICNEILTEKEIPLMAQSAEPPNVEVTGSPALSASPSGLPG